MAAGGWAVIPDKLNTGRAVINLAGQPLSIEWAGQAIGRALAGRALGRPSAGLAVRWAGPAMAAGASILLSLHLCLSLAGR